ncbi:MAG: hypothetical protein WDO73_00800 [Ignavibacteriota bacterium]
MRIVDDAFTRRPAVLTRGDDRGSAAALGALSDHFPNLWEQGKQYLSLEEIRYDLHRFFSLRSSSGQAAAALYHLDQWIPKFHLAGMKEVKAEIETEVADPALADFVKREFHIANVETGTLHAGTKCCDSLHYKSAPFHQASPTFAEDIVIPWEGKRLLDAVQSVTAKIAPRAGGEARCACQRRPRAAPQAHRAVAADARTEGCC